MKNKLRNQLTMHLELVIQIFSQIFFIISFLERQSKVGKTIKFIMGNDMEELLNFTIALCFHSHACLDMAIHKSSSNPL
jgi:hypothetical protein